MATILQMNGGGIPTAESGVKSIGIQSTDLKCNEYSNVLFSDSVSPTIWSPAESPGLFTVGCNSFDFSSPSPISEKKDWNSQTAGLTNKYKLSIILSPLKAVVGYSRGADGKVIASPPPKIEDILSPSYQSSRIQVAYFNGIRPQTEAEAAFIRTSNPD